MLIFFRLNNGLVHVHMGGAQVHSRCNAWEVYYHQLWKGVDGVTMEKVPPDVFRNRPCPECRGMLEILRGDIMEALDA